MTHREALQEYLRAMEARDCAALLRLFEPAAVVDHPIYGEKPAAEFFPDLLAAVQEDRLGTPITFESEDTPDAAALSFLDDWITSDGRSLRRRLVLVFRFAPSGLVRSLGVVFDTWGVRA